MEGDKRYTGAVTRSKKGRTGSLSSIKRLELGNRELTLIDKELAGRSQQEKMASPALREPEQTQERAEDDGSSESSRASTPKVHSQLLVTDLIDQQIIKIIPAMPEDHDSDGNGMGHPNLSIDIPEPDAYEYGSDTGEHRSCQSPAREGYEPDERLLYSPLYGRKPTITEFDDLKAAIRVFVQDLDVEMTSLKEGLVTNEESVKFLSDEQLDIKKTLDETVGARLNTIEIRVAANTVEWARDKAQTAKMLKDMEDRMKELHKEMEKLKAKTPPKVVPREEILGELMASSKAMRETLEARMGQRTPMTAKEQQGRLLGVPVLGDVRQFAAPSPNTDGGAMWCGSIEPTPGRPPVYGAQRLPTYMNECYIPPPNMTINPSNGNFMAFMNDGRIIPNDSGANRPPPVARAEIDREQESSNPAIFGDADCYPITTEHTLITESQTTQGPGLFKRHMAYNRQVHHRSEPAVTAKDSGKSRDPTHEKGANNWDEGSQDEDYSEGEEPSVDEQRQRARYGKNKPKENDRYVRPPKPDTQ
jgi:hypothetical protein